MTVQKQAQVIWSAVTLVPASPLTVALANTVQGHGTLVHRRITNAGLGPTIEATIEIEVSLDNVSWLQFGTVVAGGTGGNAVTETIEEIPRLYPFVRLVAGGNTAQNVTIDATASVATFEG